MHLLDISFQDLMTNANFNDRIQCELMGHYFTGERQDYGFSAWMKVSKKQLKKLALRVLPDLIHNSFSIGQPHVYLKVTC